MELVSPGLALSCTMVSTGVSIMLQYGLMLGLGKGFG